MTVERVRGYRHAFDQQVRLALKQQAVFERARLAFVGVTEQVSRLAGVLSDEAPLHPRGESRAAAPAQPARLHFFGDGRRLHLQGLLKRLVAAALAITFESGFAGRVNICENYLLIHFSISR